MRVLMVGCGAVGQVFGLHLRRAGVELAFYARPASAERLRRALAGGGLPVFQTSHYHRRHPVEHRLEGYKVVLDLEGSRDFGPDQIWFATPSTVLYTVWVREFLAGLPSDRVVLFAPEGPRAEHAPETAYAPGTAADGDRIVYGGVTLIAWQGDLRGAGGSPDGVTYWLPPFAAIPLVGTDAAIEPVAQLLRAGGLRATTAAAGSPAAQAAATALLSTLMAGLELAGWSFRSLRRSPWLARAARAAREAIVTQLSDPGAVTQAALRVGLSATTLSLSSFVIPLLIPFRLEPYLKFHYTKTRVQTLALLALFIRDGRARGLPVSQVQMLLDGLRSEN